MYERPQLRRFGSLRELTEAGSTGDTDGWFLLNSPSVTGCDLYNGSNPCTS
jgi:hypothetical protein